MKLSLDDWDRKIANPCAKYPSPTHTDGRTLYRKRLRVYTLHNWKNKQKIWDYFFVVKFTSWCIFCIYKISYQILFPLSMCSYVKSFFMKKVSKYHFWAKRRDKLLIYNKIEEWYILDYLTRSIIEVSLIW